MPFVYGMCMIEKAWPYSTSVLSEIYTFNFTKKNKKKLQTKNSKYLHKNEEMFLTSVLFFAPKMSYNLHKHTHTV